MADAESPEQLPIGWTEKLDYKDGEEIKFYYNVMTGMKIYSKADLLRYVELGIPSQNTRQQTRAQKEGNAENRLTPMLAKANKAPEWLPQGWIVELNATSSGQKYKMYIDPLTGHKFKSRPAILKYFNSDECNNPAEQNAMSIGYDSNSCMGESSAAETSLKAEGSHTRKGTSVTTIQKLMSSSRTKDFEIIRCEAKGLPPGWIKEIKIEKTGDKIRKDPYITDPDSKYVFHSLLDALRYLKTKNLKACSIKPRKRKDMKFLSDDTSLYIDPSTGRKFEPKPAISKNPSSDECNDPSAKTAMSIGYDINSCTGESSGAKTPMKAEGSHTRKGTSVTSIQKLMSSSRPKDFEIVRCEAKGLPPGWIKEIKIEKTGDKIRKDPYFTDPDSKYVFRSLLDALRYLETKNIKACSTKPRKRQDLKFLSDDAFEEKQSLDNATEEFVENEENHFLTSGQLPRTPISKRKQGKPVASPSTDNLMQQEIPAELVIDCTKNVGKKDILEEARNLGPQPFEKLGGESSFDPCLEFAFKTLRGDIPVEANNLAAPSYHHQQRPSFNVGFPSFSDYAHRQT